jgi:hypothetical protein
MHNDRTRGIYNYMFDTKINLANNKFEQATGDTLSLYGTNNFYGAVNVHSSDPIQITGTSVLLKSNVAQIDVGDYQLSLNVNDGWEQSNASMSTSTFQFTTNDDWNNGYYSFSRSSGSINLSSSDGPQSSLSISPFSFSLTCNDSENNSSLFLGGYTSSFQCGDFTFSLNTNSTGAMFTDARATTKGIEYEKSSYWTGFTNASLTNKEYVDLHQLRSFTVSTLPSASVAGRLIYVSDEVGGAVVAFSDGTNWRRITDRTIVS